MTERDAMPEIILFDVGGVLVELGPHPMPPEFGIPLARYSESSAAIEFEKGFIGAEDFVRRLRDELGIDADVAAMIDHFRRWPIATYPGAIELLNRLRRRFGIALLSNTNEIHWPRFGAEFGLLDCCDRIFASHLLGMMKPEAEIYEHVIDALATAPETILFLDDNPANVAAAASAGMQAELVRGFESALGLLSARGIVGIGEQPAGGASRDRREDTA
jgi:putative hydrolase of the HAD superfamily